MLQEEKELEAKLFGTPETVETTAVEAPVVPVKPEAVPIVEEAVVAPVLEKPATEEPVVQEREEDDWKKRFTNLRNSRDTKMYEAQRALAQSQAQIVILQERLQVLSDRKPEIQEDVFKDAFTDEEREALGETAIAAMQKTAKIAADARTEKINQELADTRESARKTAELQAKASADIAYQTFVGRLSNVVPEYKEIDHDPLFKDFMDTADIDGSPRLDSFLAADARGDAATVAKHMLDFIASKDPKAAAKAALNSKLEVVATATATTNTPTKESTVLSMRDIDAHYKKHTQGYYKGRHKEYLAFEARIDAAVAKGEIRS